MSFDIQGLDEESSKKSKELYVEDGLHLAGVADSVGVDPETLRVHLIEEGVGLDTNDIPSYADLAERIELLRDPHDDPVVLRELRERGDDAEQIAEDLGVDEGTIEKNLARHQVGSATLFEYSDVDEETSSARQTEASLGREDEKDPIEQKIDGLEHPHRNEAVLRYLWEEKGLSQDEVADRLDVHKTTIGEWLRENDIREKMSPIEAAKKRWGYDEGARIKLVHDDEGDPEFSVPDPEPLTERERIESKVEKQDRPWRDCQVLTYYWREEGLGCHEIADEIGTNHQTVEEWIDTFSLADEDGIARRREETLDNPQQSPMVLERYAERGCTVEETAEALDAPVENVSSRADQYGVEFDRELARFDAVDEFELTKDGDEIVVVAT